MDWCVYCLATIQEPLCTYIGATNNVDRRLSQHNKEKGGGARATGRRPGSWYRVCYVKGFVSKVNALRFEWRWKFLSRKESGNPLEKREKGLDKTMEWAKGELGEELKVVYE